MRKIINREHIEGRVYEHTLALKTVQNTASANYGKEFIGGSLDVATDEACLNVITINFTYVTEFTSKGTKNATFTALKTIIENGKSVIADGKDAATMVKIDTALALNDFFSERAVTDTNPDGKVSAKRNEGGFVHIVNAIDPDENKRNTFECDFLINGTRMVEADPEKNIAEDYLVVKGATFNFRNAILPMDFTCRIPGGIKYFEGLDASQNNMVFTKVWGKINSQNIVTKVEEESEFGDPIVKEFTRSVKDWTITGCSSSDKVYEIGDEKNGITVDEIKTALADREKYLADVKKRQEEYQASLNAAAPASSVSAADGGFLGF